MSHQVISAADVKGNFYGGLPYNVNWSFNGGETPSTLSVSVVNERGVYSTPNLSFRSESVRIGGFSFRGYLTEYNFKSSPSQKTLELTYTDQSIDLDRFFVALNYKHKEGNSRLYLPNVIYVGKEYHPCDKNLDSTVSYAESNQRQIDNCDPCPFMPKDKYDFACDPKLNNFEIFEVYYTFNDLIANMPSIFNVRINANQYKFFKAQHTGSLRNVLSSWCSDLGLSYFWDPVTNTLNIIDRKQPINIPTPPSNVQIIDLNQGATISNTFSRGFIGSFEKAAQIKDYNCTNETTENLKCLTTQDLFRKVSSGSALSNPEAPLEADVKELTSIVSYLGKEARTAFLWFWYYENTTPERTRRLIVQDSNLGQNDTSASLHLKSFGNMKIRDVFYAKGNSTQLENFLKCKGELTSVELERLKNEDKNRGRDPENDPSYYFFLAEVDEELAERQLETDINMARNFLGKFWFKKFKAKIPGATNLNSQVTVETPEGEGSAQWYPVDEDMSTLSIFGFGHEPDSFVGTLLKDIDKEKRENEISIKAARNAAKNFNKNSENLRSVNSFILLERNTKWHIPGGDSGSGEDALQWYDSLFQYYKDISPQVFGNAEGRPDWLTKITKEASTNSNLKLFIARDLRGTQDPDFKIKFSSVPHPDEPKQRKQKTEDVEDVFGNTITINKGSWGLRSTKCIRIEMPGITFFPPVEAVGNNKFFQADDGDSGFTVFAASSADFKKFLPKQQLVYGVNAGNLNCAKVDYHIKQLNEDNLSKLNAGRCLISLKAFSTYAGEISQFSSYTNSQPSRSMSFKMAGLFPVIYNVSQGLSSINIEVSDNGIFTSYSFEDLIIQPPSDEYVEQYLRDSLLSKKSVGYLTPYNEQSMKAVSASLR